jgi:hypothetical protein
MPVDKASAQQGMACDNGTQERAGFFKRNPFTFKPDRSQLGFEKSSESTAVYYSYCVEGVWAERESYCAACFP